MTDRPLLLRLYTGLLYTLLPLALLRLLWKSLRSPSYLQGWSERLGRYPAASPVPSIWIHAVSVGEVQAASLLIKKLMAGHPDQRVVVTTTTPTGRQRVADLFQGDVACYYFPYDVPSCINGFVDHVNPRLLIMIETEIWPNLLAICQRRQLATILANARLSERSAGRYARLGRFTRDTFRRISMVAAQGEDDAQRFIRLGARPERVRVTGSIKFDLQLSASLHEQSAVMRRQWGNRPVWVAASTHEGEEEKLLRTHSELLRHRPDALLVMVPRHPERFDRVASLCASAGFNTVRRSTGGAVTIDTAVFVGDTMGELTCFIGASDATFVGGSLVPVGGHNVLEPAALGVPILFGPHMFNFQVISEMLVATGAALQVANEDELAIRLADWLTDASDRARAGERGRQFVSQNRGALDRLLTIVTGYLP